MAYITMRLHNGVTISGGAVKTLISYALRRRGQPCWREIGVDVFSGAGETLVIARPEERVEIRLADYALPFLYKFFTD